MLNRTQYRFEGLSWIKNSRSKCAILLIPNIFRNTLCTLECRSNMSCVVSVGNRKTLWTQDTRNPIPAVAFYRNKVERIVGFAIYFVFAYFTLAAPLLKAWDLRGLVWIQIEFNKSVGLLTCSCHLLHIWSALAPHITSVATHGPSSIPQSTGVNTHKFQNKCEQDFSVSPSPFGVINLSGLVWGTAWGVWD